MRKLRQSVSFTSSKVLYSLFPRNVHCFLYYAVFILYYSIIEPKQIVSSHCEHFQLSLSTFCCSRGNYFGGSLCRDKSCVKGISLFLNSCTRLDGKDENYRINTVVACSTNCRLKIWNYAFKIMYLFEYAIHMLKNVLLFEVILLKIFAKCIVKYTKVFRHFFFIFRTTV